ncbi:MAG: PucR family transcriptional regulator [Haloechinothrix sp.]
MSTELDNLVSASPRVASGQQVDALWASVPRELVRRHLPTFLPTVGQLTRDMIREIQRAVPTYARPLEGYFGAIMMAGVEQAVRRTLDSLGTGKPPDDSWIDLFRKLGRVEFTEGRSLDFLQTAYRVGGRVAWRHVSAWGVQQRLPMSTLTLIAEAIFAYLDQISTLSIQGYTEAQSESVRLTERHRRRLIALILAGSAGQSESLATLVASAHWRLPERVAVVALEPVDAQPDLSLPDLPDDVLIDLDRDPPCLITADPDRQLANLPGELHSRHACVGPTVALAEARTSLRLARRGLELLRRGIIAGGPVIWCRDHLSTLCVLSDEFLMAELLKQTLRPLSAMTPKQRERTAETLLAWMETRGTVSEVAERLGIHPQTVRYRMRQIDELFSCQLADPDQRLDLEIALRARQTMRSDYRNELANLY